MSSRLCTNDRVGDLPVRRVRVARCRTPAPGCGHGRPGAPAQPVAQQRRAVGDLVGEVVPAAPGTGRRARGRAVGPYDRPGAARRDLGHRGVVVHREAARARRPRSRVRQGRRRPLRLRGRIGDRDRLGLATRFSLSGKPPRQAPLVRSTSNGPTRPWLTVVNRSTRGQLPAQASAPPCRPRSPASGPGRPRSRCGPGRPRYGSSCRPARAPWPPTGCRSGRRGPA